MRRPLSLALSVSLLVVLASAAEASSRHHHVWRCRPHHPHLIVSNKRAEVFEVGETDEVGDFSATHFDGCAYGFAHPYQLGITSIGSSSGVGASSDYTLAGTTAAYTESFLQGPFVVTELWSVWVVNLRTGRVIHHVWTGTPPCKAAPSESPIVLGPLVSLVLREDGAVAWMVSDQERRCPFPEGTREVHALDRSGERVLAVGTDIDPHSLALKGSTIYWRQGGALHAAPLN